MDGTVSRIIDRPRYLERIWPFVDKPLVKVLTGVRRCGKSTILQTLAKRLQEEHPEAQFVHLNLESVEGFNIDTAEKLLKWVEKRAPQRNVRTYIFLDEIQQVSAWEKTINALRVSWDCDIYVTGSNSTMLSGDLATHLAGRYISFHIQPFSFAEFVRLHRDVSESTRLFDEYVHFGGFPSLKFFEFDRAASLDYLRSIFDSTIIRDVIEYHQIRDVDIFHRIVEYCFSNVGRSFSAQSISKYLKSQQRTVSVDTVLNYLRFCAEAFLIDRVPRVVLPGKKQLRSNEKYYAVDHGLREAVGQSNSRDIELVLENIVFQELRSRGWNVLVGRTGTQEIDFVASKDDRRHYFQVSYLLATAETREREFGALERVTDNFPKTVLSMDSVDFSEAGIEHRNIVDFLLDVPEMNS